MRKIKESLRIPSENCARGDPVLTIYGLKNCDTCRKALKALKALPDAEFCDVRTEGVPIELLEQAIAQYPDIILNTRSTTWRGLAEAERNRDILSLLTEHPALIKRPLINVDKAVFVSWTKEIEAEIKSML